MLRELLQKVSEHPSDYFHHYRMFEALVKEFEAAHIVERRLVEARAAWGQLEASLREELAESHAERGRLARKWGKAEKWKSLLRQRAEVAESRLAEAKAEIEALRKRKAWWKHSVESWKSEELSWHEEMRELRKELAEAKAEIEEFRLSRRVWKQQCQSARKQRAEAEAVVKSLAIDAEIGRLVRGLENETGFHHQDGQYYAVRFGWKYPRTLGYSAIADSKSADPAEALRAIQEMGDD